MKTSRIPASVVAGRIDTSGGPDACHPWMGLLYASGYARICHSHENWRVTRWLLRDQLALRPELLVLHSCDNKICCNVRHLRVGTQAENMAEMGAKKRGGKSRGTRRPSAKLNDDLVRELRWLRRQGHSYGALAREFGVGLSVCFWAITRKTWKHVV